MQIGVFLFSLACYFAIGFLMWPQKWRAKEILSTMAFSAAIVVQFLSMFSWS